jgi:sarcosine oxidase gamma subunit
VRIALALVAAALLATPAAAQQSARSRACGHITVRLGGNDFSYRIVLESGRATCTTARSTLRTFIVRAVAPGDWYCARGHGADRWAAACARKSPRALVRAYLIAG